MKMHNVSHKNFCRSCDESISYIGFADVNELEEKVVANSVSVVEMEINHYVFGNKKGIMIPVEVNVTCPHCGEINKFGNAICIE